MQTLYPITVLVGINSFFSFMITVKPPLFETTWIGLTQVLFDMAYINPAFSYLRTSFFTASFITGLSLLWCSIEVLEFSSMMILCIKMDGLIPLTISTNEAIASLCFHIISTTFCFSSTVKFASIITGLNLSSPKKCILKMFW